MIGLGGDKEYLTFTDARDGWLTVYDNSGVPDLYHTADEGTSWRRQAVGLPAGVALPFGKTGKRTVWLAGTLFQPRFVGQIGLLPEQVGFSRQEPRTDRGLDANAGSPEQPMNPLPIQF